MSSPINKFFLKKVDMLSEFSMIFGAVLNINYPLAGCDKNHQPRKPPTGPHHIHAHSTAPDTVIDYPKLYIHSFKKKEKEEDKTKGKKKKKKIVHYRGHFWC